jgi:signal transduction histidine kinase
MEKLTLSSTTFIDSIISYLKESLLSSFGGWEQVIKRPSVKFRTYTGVAGIIRRRMVISISVALFSGSFSILIGFFLYASKMVDLGEAITVIGILFVMGLMLNGWLLLRMMSNPLKNIEYVEDTLVKMVESETYRIDEKTLKLDNRSTPFLQAYSSLLDHIDSIETHNLEFLAKVSHEIRSPLASILGYAELLTDSELSHDERFIDNCYHIIRKEGNQVARLVEDAVLAAGIGSGHYNFDFVPLRIDQLTELIIDEERKRTNREIIFNNQNGEIIILADALGLREAIGAIINNSIKFSPPNTQVEISLSYANNPDWIDISITDHGIGIDEKDKSIIFRRFTRIYNEFTGDIPGNGLGLYIANNIVLNHQGEIKVNSQPGAGSTFSVLLPVERSDN